MFALNDTYTTSHSSIVKSQLGMSMQMLRPSLEAQTTSEISDPGRAASPSFSGTYTMEWQIIQSCMRKLGVAPPPPAPPLPKQGPDGDPYGVSVPMVHDIRDGTGYNHT